jgi:hypothetical protein
LLVCCQLAEWLPSEKIFMLAGRDTKLMGMEDYKRISTLLDGILMRLRT